MKPFSRNLCAISLALLMAGGTAACASKQKAAAGPEATRAADANPAPEKSVAAQAPDAQDMKRQEAAEAERQKQLELDKLKAEEAAKIAAANALQPEKFEKVYFDFDKYDIKPKFRASLEHDASIIKSHASTNVAVEGHCDERGSEEYNLALGQRRATSVKKYLVSLGVNESQIHTISYGEERPADTGHDEAAWALNRRSQFSQE
ncbi:MAG: peptidoglycan-associated lipoprotein Pal [Candidatus Nitrosotenuis sp.]|nr:MAG: peptidoglycan-associated lipoprotein Pal [Candidatus Nitrosotenuis sp.]